MLNLETLQAFDTAAEANLIIAILENNGIEAIIENDQDVLVNPGALTNNNIKVKVRKEDVEIANRLLEEYQEES